MKIFEALKCNGLFKMTAIFIYRLKNSIGCLDENNKKIYRTSITKTLYHI